MKKSHCIYCVLIALAIGILIGAVAMYKNLNGRAILNTERNQQIILQDKDLEEITESLNRAHKSLTRFISTLKARAGDGD